MIAAAPVLRDGIDGKAFQNAKGEDMLGIGVDARGLEQPMAVLEVEQRARGDGDDEGCGGAHGRQYRPPASRGLRISW